MKTRIILQYWYFGSRSLGANRLRWHLTHFLRLLAHVYISGVFIIIFHVVITLGNFELFGEIGRFVAVVVQIWSLFDIGIIIILQFVLTFWRRLLVILIILKSDVVVIIFWILHLLVDLILLIIILALHLINSHFVIFLLKLGHMIFQIRIQALSTLTFQNHPRIQLLPRRALWVWWKAFVQV